jgi:hypothetical protein
MVARTGQDTRFYLHNDRSSTTNYTSGLQFFQEMAFPFFPKYYDLDFPENQQPYNFTSHIAFKPWFPGSKLGQNYTAGGVNDPLWSVPKSALRSTIKNQSKDRAGEHDRLQTTFLAGLRFHTDGAVLQCWRRTCRTLSLSTS